MSMTTRDRALALANEAGARLLHALERFVVRSSLVPTTPFLPLDVLAWIPDLESNWKIIRAELDQVLSYRDALPNFQDISVDQASITDDDGWKTYFFFGYGFRSAAELRPVPQDRGAARWHPRTDHGVLLHPGSAQAHR